jgi:hypothetical protein
MYSQAKSSQPTNESWQPLLQPGEYNQPEDEYNQPEVYNHYNHPAQHTPGVSYHASPSAIEQSQQNVSSMIKAMFIYLPGIIDMYSATTFGFYTNDLCSQLPS